MSSKPSLPRGTRDFGPQVMAKRNYIFSTIRSVFQRFGFQPLETPSMEQLSVLTGKYGDEGDQLIFKIVNSGNFLENVPVEALEAKDSRKLLPQIAEKALRYDLTVPFARFVVMNRNEIAFPFKRYQMQPVWRADRPQKGRYREFYQCDADVVGTDSLFCEAELVLMADEILSTLGLDDFTIQINNRKILTGLAEAIGEPGKEGILCVAIDKIDKIGEDGVKKELADRGIAENGIDQLLHILQTQGTPSEQLATMSQVLKDSETGLKGIAEVRSVLDMLSHFPIKRAQVVFNLSLARGLSYYTGCIFEIKAGGVQMGSISGGGRYDNLTGVFGLSGVSGVGISFGVDRIYDVLEELKLFPASAQRTTDVLITTFDGAAHTYGFQVLNALRQRGLNSELYPEPVKIKKQMEYADNKKVPFVIIIGSDEMNTGLLTLKNMLSGEQSRLALDDIIALVLSHSHGSHFQER
ncbi:MAG: histidine--tRNA ligase [Cytophagales bacterium]|nr:histidine--tRNA ligase [Cytophagales bacterium]